MWVEDCYNNNIPTESNMIQEKVKSLYNNLKPKGGEGYKARQFNASKGWFDNFRKRFGQKNVKRIGEAASADQQTAGEFPDSMKKLLRRKDICLNKFLIQTKVPHSGKKCHKGHFSFMTRKGREASTRI